MSEPVTLDQSDETEIEALLLGHRIVAAERGDYEVGRYNRPTGRLTLDDGTVVYVEPNQGDCACSAGDYELAHLASVDNVITSVRLAVEVDEQSYDQRYRIYVVADAAEINLLSVDGDDGSGYYGTGYELFVVPPQNAADAS